MRGSTLTKILSLFRQEARLSQNPAHNIGDEPAQIQHIQRVYEELWTDYDWPHLKVKRDMVVQQGQRYYDLQSVSGGDLDFDRIIKVEFRDGARWYDLKTPIYDKYFTATDSDIGTQSWPVQAWHISEGEQIEVWPIPNRNGQIDVSNGVFDGVIRFWGIKKPNQLVNGSDIADIDDRLIAMMCGAERLAATGAKDAQYKTDRANVRLARLRGNMIAKRSFNMFSVNRTSGQQSRRSITYVAAGGGGGGSGGGGIPAGSVTHSQIALALQDTTNPAGRNMLPDIENAVDPTGGDAGSVQWNSYASMAVNDPLYLLIQATTGWNSAQMATFMTLARSKPI